MSHDTDLATIRGLGQRILRLETALRDITRIGPLGVDTYPECYRRIQKIAESALETGTEPRHLGWDLAAGPDKTVWYCSECGIDTAPCTHYEPKTGAKHD